MYNPNDKNIGLVSFSLMKDQAELCLEELNWLSESDNFIYNQFLPKPWLQESQNYSSNAPKVSLKEMQAYHNSNLCLVATSSAFTSKSNHFTGIILAQLASNKNWVTYINSFDKLGVEINQTAIVRYLVVADDMKGKKIASSMLWNLEKHVKNSSKRYILANVNASDINTIKAMLNVGYIIKHVDLELSESKVVMYKDLAWSSNINFFFYDESDKPETINYMKLMSDKNYLINKQKIDDNIQFCDVLNFNELQNMLHNGYYPTDIVDGKYSCSRIVNLSVENVVSLWESANVA